MNRLSMYGVGQNSTIHLNRRLRGGASDWELIVKPRIQKDRWSDYWKVNAPPHLMEYAVPPDVRPLNAACNGLLQVHHC